MSTVTTHVLDTALGRPAVGVPVRLERALDRDPSTAGGASLVAQGRTDVAGRVSELGPDDLAAGVYRLVFDTATYFAATRQPVFFPEVIVVFALTPPVDHHHVPVLLSPFAFSTYRGN